MRSPHPAAVIFKSVASKGIGNKGGRLSGRPPFVCPGGCRTPRPAPRPRLPPLCRLPSLPRLPPLRRLSLSLRPGLFPFFGSAALRAARRPAPGPLPPAVSLPAFPHSAFPLPAVPQGVCLHLSRSLPSGVSPAPCFPVRGACSHLSCCFPPVGCLSRFRPFRSLSSAGHLSLVWPASSLPSDACPPPAPWGGGGDKIGGRAEREVNTPYFPGNKALKSLPAGRGRPRGYRKAGWRSACPARCQSLPAATGGRARPARRTKGARAPARWRDAARPILMEKARLPLWRGCKRHRLRAQVGSALLPQRTGLFRPPGVQTCPAGQDPTSFRLHCALHSFGAQKRPAAPPRRKTRRRWCRP